MIVVVDKPGDAGDQFGHVPEIIVENIIILDRSPKAFNENVIQRSTFTIHADADLFITQYWSKLLAGELAALVSVENFRITKPFQGLMKSLLAKSTWKSIADSPRQNLAAVKVNNCQEISGAFIKFDVGDICRPDLIDVGYLKVSE